MSYIDDWYFLRVKFTNDSNFFVCEVGQGSDVQNVAWKLQKCCEGVEGGDGDRKSVCTYFGNRIAKVGMLTRLETRKNFSVSSIEFLAVEKCDKQLDRRYDGRRESTCWRPARELGSR